MLLVEFSMTPLGMGESVSKWVAGSLEIVEQSGLPYRLGPMGTTLEGEWDEVMNVLKACYERMHEDCHRISCSIRIDARDGAGGRLDSKIDKVEQLVGHQLKT